MKSPSAKSTPGEPIPPAPIVWPADKVERRLVRDLVPYALNSRVHSDQQIDQLAASIKEWGWTSPVLVDETGSIIAGHGRVLAAQKLGITEVPTMVAVGWSDLQKKAYVIADNKLAENATWDAKFLKLEITALDSLGFNVDLIGFGATELAGILATDLEPINVGDGEGRGGAGTFNMAIGKQKVPLTEEEHTALLAAVDAYVEGHGALYGFATYLLQLIEGDKMDDAERGE